MADRSRIAVKLSWSLILLILFVPLSYAKTQYVTDVLHITLRAGPGDSFKVLRAMKTGTKLEILETSADGYSLVRTEKGDEGWASSKYLVNDPVAVLKLQDATSAMELLQNENLEQKQVAGMSSKKIKELEKDRKRLESANINLSNDNKKMKVISAKPMEISKENAELKALNETHESQINALLKENKKFKDNTTRDWFITGGGVLVFGIVLGVLFPSIRWRKNKGWA